MTNPTDKITAGLNRNAQARSLELVANAPKTLAALVELSTASESKRLNLANRSKGYGVRMKEAEDNARENFKDVIPLKRDGKIREAVNAARATILKADLGQSAKMAA